MRLKTIILKNFRSYKEQIEVPIQSDLTALIGKNDVGKSTILEALEIFFNGQLVKMQQDDCSVPTSSEDKDVVIGCVFDQLPEILVIDDSSKTTLAEEYLLNEGGDLEIHKVYNCGLKSPKESVYVNALHPTAESVRDLLQLKNTELKNRLEEIKTRSEVDRRSNVSLRKAIRDSIPKEELRLETQRIALDKEDAKKIWEKLKGELPMFALFRSDRASSDEDSEVQDPMKLAIKKALQSVDDLLTKIKEKVEHEATEIAENTLKKLQEMDSGLAQELKPSFKSDPNWASLFKLSLTGDDQIPINKRGSGTRRLILLNFFRAQTEMNQKEGEFSNIIYAIEEPETSQHPDNQKMLLDTLLELSSQEWCQVLITTHVPGLAGYLPLDSLRYIVREGKRNDIHYGGEEVYRTTAEDLGVLSDSRVKVLVCVEGPNDVTCLGHLSRICHQHNSELPSLAEDPRIVMFPLGGSTLTQWVNKHYFKSFNLPEIHIYDHDVERYEKMCQQINQRGGQSWATLTGKKELENYLHPAAIKEEFNVDIKVDENSDVPLLVAMEVHKSDRCSSDWNSLSDEKIKKKISSTKKRLNDDVAKRMNYSRIREADPDGDIEGWLKKIAERLV